MTYADALMFVGTKRKGPIHDSARSRGTVNARLVTFLYVKADKDGRVRVGYTEPLLHGRRYRMEIKEMERIVTTWEQV